MRVALLPALLLGVGTIMVAPASAQDSAQICMFRCAPQLGEKGYDQCLEECFSSEEPIEEGNADNDTPPPAAGADISPLFGFWQASHTPCGELSDDSWDIEASGASPYESLCKLRAASRDGDTFTLDQDCTFFEDEVEKMTTHISLIDRNAIEIGDVRYQRCERP